MFSHACAKGCLFLVAGVFIYKLRIRRVTELMGIGRTMPLTLACFTLASISLVGIPPMGGFTSKWAIATAAMDSGAGVFAVLGPVVLLISALLTAGYLLPVMVGAYADPDVHPVRGIPAGRRIRKFLYGRTGILTLKTGGDRS